MVPNCPQKWGNPRGAEGVDYCLRTNSNYTFAQAALRACYGALCAEAVLTETWQGFDQIAMDPFIEKLTIPTLLMMGKNGVIQPEEATAVAALNPIIHLKTVAKAGHNIPWEQNKTFTGEIIRFLHSLT